MEKIDAKVSARNISCGPVITSECMANSSKRMKRTRGCSMALIMMEFSNDVMDSMMVFNKYSNPQKTKEKGIVILISPTKDTNHKLLSKDMFLFFGFL